MVRRDLQFLDAEEEEDASSSHVSSDLDDMERGGGYSSGEEEGVPACDDQAGTSATQPVTPPPLPGKKISIKLGGSGNDFTCHVCGERGHCAGFVGARYLDCPNKPCYLCGQAGHSTFTCPYRIDPGHGCQAAPGSKAGGTVPLEVLRREQGQGATDPGLDPRRRRWQVDAAVLRLHDRRVVCLEFHPRNPSIVLSGSKGGRIAVWDMDKVFERTVYRNINFWLTSGMRFMPDGEGCATSSYDGTIKIFDVETGTATTLHNACPREWRGAAQEDGSWNYVMGVDIQSLHANPVASNLLLTAGNDYAVRLLDLRMLGGKRGVGQEVLPAELASLQHSKVVNSAYFSPLTGRKILTTSQDNRLRVWDYVYGSSQEADRTIVHSNNFNRYLTPFRAEWDPKDSAERLIVCGRYISEDYGGVALHPVDILDASTGELVAELVDPNLTTISPVNKPHPCLDAIVSGSSRSLFVWRPAPEDEEDEAGMEVRTPGGSTGKQPFGFGASAGFTSFDADDSETPKKKGKNARQPQTAEAGEAKKPARKRRKGGDAEED